MLHFIDFRPEAAYANIFYFMKRPQLTFLTALAARCPLFSAAHLFLKRRRLLYYGHCHD